MYYTPVLWNRMTSLSEYEASGIDNSYLMLNLYIQTYTCDLSLLPGELSKCFVQLEPDEETEAFLCESRRRSSNVCLQLFYTCMYILLGLFFSQTSING